MSPAFQLSFLGDFECVCGVSYQWLLFRKLQDGLKDNVVLKRTDAEVDPCWHLLSKCSFLRSFDGFLHALDSWLFYAFNSILVISHQLLSETLEKAVSVFKYLVFMIVQFYKQDAYFTNVLFSFHPIPDCWSVHARLFCSFWKLVDRVVCHIPADFRALK